MLLIFPRIEHGSTTYYEKGSWRSIIFGYPIITLPYIAAITPKKHKVEIINENYEDLKFDNGADIIGITCYTMTAPRVYEIADKFRKQGKTVVLGGYHPTAMPNEALQHADSIVLGMAEASWPKLLNDFENGKLKRIYNRDPNYNLADIPPIPRDLIKHNPITGAVQSTRGCGNKCEFCAIGSFWAHGVSQRPIKQVVEEIKNMPNKTFIFHDPHLTANPRYARELFKEIIKNKIKKTWVANGTTNVLGRIDDEFLSLARKSGCIEWFVGFESINQEALNGIKKNHNIVENYKKMIKRVHDYGMTVQGGIIFGFDEDTLDTFDITLEKIKELEIDVLEVNILTPYPGTPLFFKMEKERRLLTKDWSKYNQVDVVFQPKNMTVEELKQGASKVAKEFYQIPRIIQRGVKIFSIVKKPSALIPAMTNYTFRKYYKRDLAI